MGRNIFGLYGVIPTAAAFQAEGGISRAAIAVPSKLHHPRLPPIAESREEPSTVITGCA